MDEVLQRHNVAAGLAWGMSSRRKQPAGYGNALEPPACRSRMHG